MIVKSYYIDKRTYFSVDLENSVIIDIWKSRSRKVESGSVIIERLRLTTEKTRVDGNTLFIDPLGFTDLIGWMVGQRRKWTDAGFVRSVRGYFNNEPFWTEIVRGTLHAVGGFPAEFDQSYFKGRAVANHPTEMAAIAAAWRASHNR